MNRGGYTIVETMIFLGVTGTLLISAMTLMSGRQASVQFTQGVTDAQSSMQDIIGQVSTGYIPRNTSWKCEVPTPSQASSQPTFTNTPSNQGESNSCVFLGKAIAFRNDTEGGELRVISLASRRLNAAGKEVSSLLEAKPVPITKITSSADSLPDITEVLRLQFGIEVTRITSIAGEKYGTILFLSTLPSYQAQTGTLASGAQRVSFAGLRGSLLTDGIYTSASKLVDFGGNVTINPTGGIVICLADAPIAKASRKAMLTIGEGAAQTAVKLDIGGYNKVLCED
ncbi:hypothetical protein EB118_16090 [bacterium]|nr:hypothetical protein [bacterium]NBX97469.1 hypothetical protein [bacterium]NDC95370.1 hypothetical protein [bacterium]NDD83844.1 hypothetical protein [bacterium]NDG31575.1 hypothetical protein [bacterium]